MSLPVELLVEHAPSEAISELEAPALMLLAQKEVEAEVSRAPAHGDFKT